MWYRTEFDYAPNRANDQYTFFEEIQMRLDVTSVDGINGHAIQTLLRE